ncbi:MAG: copper homeostasis protein CutC [Planctomycetota bacterium]|jgi:copper homeostasis protein
MILEVCVETLADAVLAVDCGADRLEFNSSLAADGLTPDSRELREVCSAVKVPVISMARPRSGNFTYNHVEYQQLLAAVTMARSAGASGVAFGILDEHGKIDTARCAGVVEIAEGMELVFHRAFDQVANARESLEQLIALGIQRVLTSGLAENVEGGTPMLRELHHWSDGRIEILPGGGVTSGVVRQVVDASSVRQVHGTFRDRSVGAQGIHLDGDEVRRVRAVLDRMDKPV